MHVTLRQQPAATLYGVWGPSNDRTVARDIPALAQRFHACFGGKTKIILPFYVLSRGYNRQTGGFELFVGGLEPGDGLQQATLPAGSYAVVTIGRGLLPSWGRAIGRAKRWFYQSWLPQSGYHPLDLEYELHTDKSIAKKAPAIELHFAIER